MARYFAVNSLAGAKRTTTALVETTTAGRFDSTYVSSAILIPSITDYAIISAPFLDGSTSVSDLWFRGDYYSAGNSAGQPVVFYNGATAGYRINNTSGTTHRFEYWNGSAWTSWGSTFTIVNSVVHTLVIHIIPGTSFELFLAGTSIVTGSSPTGAQSAITEARLGAAGANGCWSQVMGADYDLRDAHLMTAAINGDSASNTSGTGAYTDINETVLDESTAIVLASVGKKGQTKASITVPSGLGIAAMVINARGRVSGGTITDGKLGVRSGGTNYSSSAKSFNGGYEPRGHIAESNPATSGAWTQTSFNNAETYVEAV